MIQAIGRKLAEMNTKQTFVFILRVVCITLFWAIVLNFIHDILYFIYMIGFGMASYLKQN